MIQVQYFGHSFWKIWNEEISIAMDPFHDLGFPLPKDVSADVVFCSHDHFDHNNTELVGNTSLVINTPGDFSFKDIHFRTYSTYHDEEHGAKRGTNLVLQFKLENRVFLHCGDLGDIPSPDVISKIKNPDVLFIPVGGFYTIDAVKAHEIVQILEPVLVFPMHYKTKLVDSRIAPVLDYLLNVKKIVQVESNLLELDPVLFEEAKTIIMQF